MKTHLDLKEFRVKNRISQIELGFASGLSNDTICKVERGWKPATVPMLLKLREGFKRLDIDSENIIGPMIERLEATHARTER